MDSQGRNIFVKQEVLIPRGEEPERPKKDDIIKNFNKESAMKLLNALKFIFLLILTFNFSNCSSAGSKENKAASTDRDAFNKYWYAGKAEITRYELASAQDT